MSADSYTGNILLKSDTNELEIVEFRVDEKDAAGAVVPCHFGVNVAKVREIIRMPKVYSKCIHGADGRLAGIVRLRDRIVPMVNLARLLGKGHHGIESDRAIILEFNNIVTGVMVNSVSRIYRISWSQVEPAAIQSENSNITGIVKLDERMILLLDFEKIIGEVVFGAALRQLEQDQILSPDSYRRLGKRILIADDSGFIRNSVRNALLDAGFEVVEAENGEECLARLEEMVAAGCEPSIVISDIEMPKMDGLHFTSRCKADPNLRHIPIIIFSSMASEDNRQRWRSLGASDILTKPDLPRLVTIVDEILRGEQ